ncbi:MULTISPECIES: hypothetical protein [unclassified Lentimonas]|uniref:hypothetical protein n=1 Tax=unclassified Lentimonas TaxID=2630993 RepID=UPI0013267D80|nr:MULTISPECIES: hypothetical protein [unclassified Lentimonas]CAA6676445.1 Unannotated [Lentimonas sp. CC4]CAA6685284.1 Unannotated [Lentimonas sp. CC6]CAA7074991.1 Unannotated [Lentimonas sp. CC4]CAA7171037.1 Unannotated [Lentimonas sp. CC21]CAA7180633.1 Unannotated [Lentimonas sp. CC8]
MRIPVALIFLPAFILSACGVGGGSFSINEDYFISVANSHQVTINHRGQTPSIVVGPNVVGLNSNSRFIVGEVLRPREALDLGASPGYFIIDLETDAVLIGLSLDDFKKALEMRSIAGFTLKQPSSVYRGDLEDQKASIE